MKICWIPFGDENIASSRLRVYAPHYYINKFFSDKGFTSTIGFDPSCDVTIIQKNVDDKTAEKIQGYRGKLIFDVVDDLFAQPNFSLIAKKCDLLMTNNVNRRQQLVEKGINTNCVIWEDGIDYGINSITLPLNNNKNDLVWFGSTIRNLPSMKPIFENLKKKEKVTLSVITSPYNEIWKDQSDYHFNFLHWDLSTFTDTLRRFNLALLSHQGEGEQYKSNNKLLVCIALGIPAIVSHSFSYELLLKKFGLQEYILDPTHPKDSGELVDSLLSYDSKIEYLKEIQPYILYKYNMYEVTRQLIKTLKQL